VNNATSARMCGGLKDFFVIWFFFGAIYIYTYNMNTITMQY